MGNEFRRVANAKDVAVATGKKSGIAFIPPVLVLYGMYRSSWSIRRCLESILYQKELKKHGVPYTVTDYNFGMHLNPSDRGFSRNILWGKRESYAVSYLYNFLSKNEICFDIGANLGYYVNIVHQACPDGEIYAFEPVSDTYEYLLQNLPSKRIKTHKLALGDLIGKATINVSDNRNLSTITDHIITGTTGTETIQCTTVDAFIKECGVTPTFLRMDTEGYETKIIQGSSNLIQSESPLKIFMETHPTLAGIRETEGMIDDLLNNGFAINKIFLWNTFSDSPLAPLHDKWFKVQSRLEDATINQYGEVPASEDVLCELNKRGIGCHLFMVRQ